MIEYSIVRSKRKSIGIYILKDGSVEVRCPQHTKTSHIEAFVKSRANWIAETSAKFREQYEKRQSFELNIGDELLFLGKSYPISKSDNNHYGFDGKSFYIPDGLSSDQIKKYIIITYKALAKEILNKKVLSFSRLMGTQAIGIKINSAKTRWGSCSGRNSLNFSWKLILAPETAVDYVVVHELAHTFEHNHSKKFWAIVSEYMPDYPQRQDELSELQKKLSAENWD